EAGNAFDQQMPLREHRHQHPFEKMVLADDDAFHFVEDALHDRGHVVAASCHVVHGSLPRVMPHRYGGVKKKSGYQHRGGCQKGDRPTAAAAFSIGTAKPMPMNTRCSVGLRMPVTIPTTSPSAVTSGPPELPGLAA